MFLVLFIVFFVTIFIRVYCNCSLIQNIYALNKDDSIIPAEITSNYLQKYVNYQEVFLSISFSSQNAKQEYLQEDLFIHLLKSTKLNNFSYNILECIDQSRKENKYALNLILVDGIASLK